MARETEEVQIMKPMLIQKSQRKKVEGGGEEFSETLWQKTVPQCLLHG